MTINALLIEAADALQAVVDELVQAHTVPGTATLDSADVTLKVEAEQDLVNRLREAALVVADAVQEPVALGTVYETIIQWDEGGGKRSRRELARRIVALYNTPPAAPVQEPVYLVWLKAHCAWLHTDRAGFDKTADDERWMLYTTPPAQPAVPLTEPELRAVLEKTNHMIANTMRGPFWPELEQACRAIEAAHGITAPAQPDTPTIPSGWSLTLDGQHIKLTSPESRWWDFGPNTDGPDRLVWEFLSAVRDGVPAQKGSET